VFSFAGNIQIQILFRLSQKSAWVLLTFYRQFEHATTTEEVTL